MIFKISDDKKHIEIEHKGEKGASFDDFCSKLPDGDCRYAVLDVEIDTKSGATANKLIFLAWCAWHVRSRATSGGGGGGGARAEKREGGAVGGRGQQDAGLCPRGACRRPSLTALRPAVQVGRQRFGQAEDAVRLIEGRPQEGAHRHQR